MSFSNRKTLIASLALTALALTPLPATAQETSRPTFGQIFSVENIAKNLVRSAITWARLLGDIRYDQISVDPLALRLSLTGVRIAPYLPNVAPGDCNITVERIALNGKSLDQSDMARLRLALDGVSVPSTCLPPEPGAMMRSLGFDALNVARIEADINYDYPSGGADVRISADLENLVSLNATVDVDYFSYRMDFDTEEPVIAFELNRAQISIDDQGGWDLVNKLVAPSALNPDALAGIVSAVLEEAFTDANRPGSVLSERQRGFVEQAATVARGFDDGPRRIVLATGIEGGPMLLNEEALAAFQPLFDRLNPTVMSFAPALNASISVAELSRAFETEEPPENALEIGRALITGIGAPRNTTAGLRFLVPLARQGNTGASLLIARSVADSRPSDAYSHALVAAAAGQPGALALLDRIERDLPYAEIIAEQNKLMSGPQDALYRDLNTMRRAAREFLTGTSRARSWRAAYYWSSMAAATGDATAAAIRDEINENMRLRGDAVAWADETKSLDDGVLRDWMGKNVPAQLR